LLLLQKSKLSDSSSYFPGFFGEACKHEYLYVSIPGNASLDMRRNLLDLFDVCLEPVFPFGHHLPIPGSGGVKKPVCNFPCSGNEFAGFFIVFTGAGGAQRAQ